MSNLLVGSIVTVVLPNTRFTGKQGRVSVIVEDGNEDGPIGLVFPGYYKHLFDFPNGPNTVVRFTVEDLRLNTRDDKQDINSEQICDVLFGRRMWSIIYSIEQPLMIGFNECMHEACKKLVAARIMVNCWGTVSEVDVCKQHIDWHGRNCDGFPFKRNLTGSSTVDTSKLIRALGD